MVVLFCVSFLADVFRARTTALNESNATIAAATKVVRVDEWRFIDGSFSLDLILWLVIVCELSMGLRNRYSTALRRDLPHPFNQPFNLFFRRVTGASGAQQSLFYFAEKFDHRLRVKIPVRSEDAAFDQFLSEFN